MRIEELEKESLPVSFGDSLSENYLGNPELVNKLVSEFCSESELLLKRLFNAEIEKDDFSGQAKALINGIADKFSGRSKDYKHIVGYHDHALLQKLKADLGEFWQKNKGRWGGDPVCVMFEWLFVMLSEAVQRGGDDDYLIEIMIKPSVQYAVNVLVGTEKRR